MCGKPFSKKSGPGRWPTYCSADCKRAALSSVRTLKVNDGPCDRCGRPLPPGWTRKYCSAECRNRAGYERSRTDGRYAAELARMRDETAERRAAEQCPFCSGPMAPRKRAHCGSEECRRAHNAARGRKFMREYKAKHGVPYVAKYRPPDYLEKLKELPKDPARIAARKQENWQRRRAQKLAAPYEQFRHVDVFERDAWICGLCNRPVDRELRHPDDMSATLDHITPLSRGGHHVWDNVQLAHRTCNGQKCARLDWTPSEVIA